MFILDGILWSVNVDENCQVQCRLRHNVSNAGSRSEACQTEAACSAATYKSWSLVHCLCSGAVSCFLELAEI